MKLAMTLVARNEGDILAAQIAFHLACGVDFVVAMDHGSTDSTPDILARFAREGVLEIVRENRPWDQSRFVTALAAIAADRHGADWIINSDADEFWLPRSGNLKQVFLAIPPRFGVVFGLWRHFVPVAPEDGHFAERMIFRVRPEAPFTTASDPYHAQVKVAHRAVNGVVVGAGNHNVTGDGLTPLRGWLPLDVLHFPLRSQTQFELKARRSVDRPAQEESPQHVQRFADAYLQGRHGSLYRKYVHDESAIESALRAEWLTKDTRVRDALRHIAGVDELSPAIAFGRSPDREPPCLDVPWPGLVWEAERASDQGAVPLSHERWRLAIEDLESRVASVARRPWPLRR